VRDAPAASISRHTAANVTAAMVDQADLVIGFTRRARGLRRS
jgi:hypothetical protein